MCGITGFIDFKNRTSQEVLDSMTQTLHHRGPDANGKELLQTPKALIGLGHARLSIIDLTPSGRQPMTFNDYWICFNGEVYNYAEIKKDLVALGHSFVGGSDTEVILHAYIEWGEKAIEKFIGMFAFVIYNPVKQELFCVRDRAGIKPFFYYWKDGLFLFSSELKAFHAHPNFQKELNYPAVAAFMQYGNVPTPHCIFNHCWKLKPGHTLTISLSHPEASLNHSLSNQKSYWNVYDAYNQPKQQISFEEALNETEKLLKSACDYRMVADVPVGVFLSGGYDSASVTALLQKDRTEKLKTFTIAVPDIGLNEAPYAKDIAKHLGTDHTEINCTQQEAIDLIEDLPYYYDEPFADSSAIPTTLVSKAARQHVTVALSADAGDEVFAGYNRYDYLYRFGPKINSIPAPIRKIIAGTMDVIPSNALPILKNKYNFHNRYEKLKGILRNPSPESIMLSLSQQFTDKQLQEFMAGSFSLLDTAYTSKELKQEFFSPLAYMMAIDYQTYLVDDIMQKVDRAAMTVSLEGREPYLDHRVIEWAATLPDEYKYNNGQKKYILKEILHKYVPKEMMDRPKMGFAIPIAEWMLKDLKSMIDSFINEETIRKQGIFNWPQVKALRDAFFNGKKELDYKMWYLLMFQMWYAKWMH
jgi:asparagine synthase (glutamine-hydrolysing)